MRVYTRSFSTLSVLFRGALKNRSAKVIPNVLHKKNVNAVSGRRPQFLPSDNITNRFRPTDFDTITNSKVCSALTKELSSISHGSTSPIEDRVKVILSKLNTEATKRQNEITQLISNACPTWNSVNPDFEFARVMERYERQVLEQIDYKVPRNTATQTWTNVSDYFGFCTNTKVIPAATVVKRAYDDLVVSAGNSSEYMFMKMTAEYIGTGFLRYYAKLVEKNQPMVVQTRWKRIDLSHPENMFPSSRSIPRKIYLHIGPTNSGKTYQALQAFQKAQSGFYAGPLRLLAREVYNRMKSTGKACNLITGEEVIEEKDENGEAALLDSGTIEMINLNRDMEVAVIDEIQMIEDRDRGWAWTQAFLGVRAKEVHLCGDANTEQIIRKLTELTGDELHVKRYERLSPLVSAEKQLTDPLQNLQSGDCIVFFSKKELVKAKDEVEKVTGHKCAIIYGSLPAETRAQQALAFNDPNSEYRYLVASDAVGMGLNLAIRRVIFSRTDKFNGKYMDKIAVAQMKQIAGRAGRFHVPGHASNDDKPVPGEVTAVTRKDLLYIKDCLRANSPLVLRAGLFPPESFLRDYANSIGPKMPFHKILAILARGTRIGRDFFLTDISDMIATAELFADIPGLTLEEKIVLSKAPVLGRVDSVKEAFRVYCKVIARGEAKTLADMPETNIGFLAHSTIGKEGSTDTLEALHRTICLYLWLSYRFSNNFLDREGATELRHLCEARINSHLSGQNSSVFSRKPKPSKPVSASVM